MVKIAMSWRHVGWYWLRLSSYIIPGNATNKRAAPASHQDCVCVCVSLHRITPQQVTFVFPLTALFLCCLCPAMKLDCKKLAGREELSAGGRLVYILSFWLPGLKGNVCRLMAGLQGEGGRGGSSVRQHIQQHIKLQHKRLIHWVYSAIVSNNQLVSAASHINRAITSHGTTGNLHKTWLSEFALCSLLVIKMSPSTKITNKPNNCWKRTGSLPLKGWRQELLGLILRRFLIWRTSCCKLTKLVKWPICELLKEN